MTTAAKTVRVDQLRIRPGTLWSRLPAICGAVGLLGVLGSFALRSGDPEQFAFSWLVAFTYFLSVGLGGLFFVLVHYATKAGSKGFVIGVSGGIDSAVTSTLCARTGLELLCLEMPIHQAPSQVDRAADHIEWLMAAHPKVARQRVDLTPVFDGFVTALPDVEVEADRSWPWPTPGHGCA